MQQHSRNATSSAMPARGAGPSRVRWRARRAVDVERELIDVAPPPVFTRLVRPDDGMVVVRVPVRGGMPVRRVVATADVTARHADPQVQPALPDAQAVFTPGARRCHVGDGVEMRAGHCSYSSTTPAERALAASGSWPISRR